jgi:hypothetical protein
MSDLHAAVRKTKSLLSVEYIFYRAQRRASRPPDTGATVADILATLREDGQPLEVKWPYLLSLPTDLSQWIPPSDIAPLFRRAGATCNESFPSIVREVDLGNPSVVMLRLSPSFYSTDSTGVVDQMPNESVDPFCRHAVVAVGTGKVGRKRAVLIRNSWGTAWGDHGYAWITEEYLQTRIFGMALLKEEIHVSSGSIAA